MLKKGITYTILLLLILTIGIFVYVSKTYPNIAPITATLYMFEHILSPHKKMDKHILGFLPYWRLDDIGYIKPQLLSEINYFSLNVGSDGHLLKVVDGQTDPGWKAWQSEKLKNFLTKAQILGTDVTVTIAALDNDTIESVLESNDAQQNLIKDILEEVRTRNLQGINIDFEYFGEPDDDDRAAFTGFSKNLKTALAKESPNAHLSISIMPLAARQDDIFEFKQLVPIYDRFIGMSYEYYGASSDIAGPIAPMKGFKEDAYFFDVETTYEDYKKVIPSEKLIMGVPYYGWEWAVEDGKTKNSRTFADDHPNNYAAVISYARARESKDIKKNQCTWDELAKETWCWFKDSETGVDRQIWLADNKSVQIRFDYAKAQKLGGVAIWTLGFDKQYPDLWDMISSIFTHQ